MFDYTAPSQGHQALNDVDVIRVNFTELRQNEASISSGGGPANPVAGQFWWTTDTKTTYQRNSTNSSWVYLWSETDPPAKTSDLTAHAALNTSSSVTVHGIKLGHGSGAAPVAGYIDACSLDGQHGSYYLASTHATATSNTHGVGAGTLVGTTLTQVLTNKELGTGTSVSANVTVGAGVTIDGRDLSVDGAKLDTYPGDGLAIPPDGTVTTAKLTLTSGQRIYDSILGTTTDPVTISNLLGNTSRTYRLMIYCLGTFSNGIRLSFNGDTAANYEDAYSAATQGYLNISKPTGGGVYSDWILIDLLIYAKSGAARMAIGTCAYREGGIMYTIPVGGRWTNTADQLTSMTFTVGVSGGNDAFLAGSHIQLYSLG